jgi:hypothetical protein
MVSVPEVAEVIAFTTTVPDLPRNQQRLLVILNGFFYPTEMAVS